MRASLPAFLLLASLGACHRVPASEASAAPGDAPLRAIATGVPAVDADLAALRRATAPFHVLDSAVAAGYPRTVSECLVHEHHGAMGYHHVNRANLAASPAVARPPILLYERMPDGTYRLNGVEYIIPYSLLARDAATPVLFGQRMHREDTLNFWYLHVWVWRGNPEGVFANFHRDVACPSGQGKVYRPFERGGDAPADLAAVGAP